MHPMALCILAAGSAVSWVPWLHCILHWMLNGSVPLHPLHHPTPLCANGNKGIDLFGSNASGRLDRALYVQGGICNWDVVICD